MFSCSQLQPSLLDKAAGSSPEGCRRFLQRRSVMSGLRRTSKSDLMGRWAHFIQHLIPCALRGFSHRLNNLWNLCFPSDAVITSVLCLRDLIYFIWVWMSGSGRRRYSAYCYFFTTLHEMVAHRGNVQVLHMWEHLTLSPASSDSPGVASGESAARFSCMFHSRVTRTITQNDPGLFTL